jgi:hypothetical protein
MTDFLSEACDIGDLQISLRNISEDDKRELSSYTKKEVVDEAKWVLSVFNEGGTISNDILNGEYGKSDQAIARKEVKQLKAFIKKYS